MNSQTQLSNPFSNMIPNKMVHNLDVFGPRVKYRIFNELYGASVCWTSESKHKRRGMEGELCGFKKTMSNCKDIDFMKMFKLIL